MILGNLIRYKALKRFPVKSIITGERNDILICRVSLILLFIMGLATVPPAVGGVLPNSTTRMINAEYPASAYKLYIYTPDTPAPPNGYPVIYLLDGNSVFGSMTDEVRRRASIGYGEPSVVVAIGYPEDAPWNTRRTQDLVAWEVDEKGVSAEGKANQPVGANNFLSVIKTQIIPTVENEFNINPHRRTLVGHSFGGFFTLQVFFLRTGLFQNYVAASPSIWYANERLFDEFNNYAAIPNNTDTSRLLLMVGGCEETPGECDLNKAPSPKMDEWLVNTGKMVSNVKIMYRQLKALPEREVHLRIFEGENHVSVIGGSLTWAASFAMTAPVNERTKDNVNDTE